ncbi:hypothetical protein HYW21_03110 [Candidatus Woesearchaeota archaeon]|nr:hypothetical protein [Candidatus Woesearchaeota archaeon]
MKDLQYDFSVLEYKTYFGSGQVFQRIKAMIIYLDQSETYHHFVGHSDTLWNTLGMPDRSRREIVPIKQQKRIATIGLYYPAEWLVEKFGKDRAVTERREMRFLPEGISFPIRFYCYKDTVHYIFENERDFNSVEVSDISYARRQRELVERMVVHKKKGEKANVSVSEFPNDMISQFAVCSYMLLDLFSNHITEVEVNLPQAKKRLSDLVTGCRGIDLMVK